MCFTTDRLLFPPHDLCSAVRNGEKNNVTIFRASDWSDSKHVKEEMFHMSQKQCFKNKNAQTQFLKGPLKENKKFFEISGLDMRVINKISRKIFLRQY